MLLRNFEKLAGVQSGRPLDPGVERIGRDAVELFLRRQQIMTAIIDSNFDFWIANNVEVVFRKIRRNDFRDKRFDLRDGFLLQSWLNAHRARRNACAATDHENPVRILGDQRREMSEHPLQPHVRGVARCLDLSGVVIIPNTVRQIRNGN